MDLVQSCVFQGLLTEKENHIKDMFLNLYNMERVKVSRNFFADEFLHPQETDISKMDSKIIIVAQWLRDQLGKPVTINNWATGGHYHESGLRSLTTKTGAKKSAHKPLPEHGGIGKAIDIKIKGMTGQQMFDWALKHQMELYALGVREIENAVFTKSWLHLSTRGNHLAIKIIKP